jgi:hypothetical protein
MGGWVGPRAGLDTVEERKITRDPNELSILFYIIIFSRCAVVSEVM